MGLVGDVARGAVSRSADPLQRADPMVTGAATAYYGLFALVPMTIAFAALLTFFDGSGTVLQGLVDLIDETLPETIAGFLNELIEESYQWVSDAHGVVLVISIALALLPGSRAVFTIQKALSAAEGTDENHGYLRSRGLGVVITALAGLGVMLAYLVLLAGNRFWDQLASDLGTANRIIPRSFVIAVIIVLAWLVLWALYRWGPPQPMEYPGIVAAAVGALLVLGTVVALQLVPDFSSSSASIVAAIGLFLIWFYYLGVVIVAAPILVEASSRSVRSVRSAERNRR